MSAFCDIWISGEGSNTQPVQHRVENKSWNREDTQAFSCWKSMPANGTFDFLQEVHSETYHLLVLGQFYEAIDIQFLLSACAAYTQGQEVVFNDPSGHYLLMLTNKANKHVHVFTNRLGTYHIYHSREGGRNVLGTYYLGLAKETKGKDLDWEGITGFLAMGFFPDDSTYLKNIRILNPASHYHFDASLKLVSQARYWNWKHRTTNDSVSDYIARLDEVLKTSVNYALAGRRTALPISGGLDSRTLAGVMTTAGRKNENDIWGYSYGYTADSVETAIANKIATARQIPFDGYVVPNYLFDKMDVITDSVELFQYVDGTRQASMKELLEEKSDVVIGGHWGDVWMDSMGIDDMPGSSREEKLMAAFDKKIIKRGSDWLLTEVCAPHLANGKEYLRGYFKKFTEQYKDVADADFVFKIFKTDQWSFRWTLASIRMYQAAVFPILPFYDNRMVDLFQQVPTHLLGGRSLQIEYLKKYHPDLARITWQDYDNNLYYYKLFNNRNIAYRIVKKVQRMIKGETPILRNWEVFYLNGTGREQLEKIFLDNLAFNEIVSKEKCRSLLDSFYSQPSAANGFSVSMLHTFAKFIQQIS